MDRIRSQDMPEDLLSAVVPKRTRYLIDTKHKKGNSVLNNIDDDTKAEIKNLMYLEQQEMKAFEKWQTKMWKMLKYYAN